MVRRIWPGHHRRGERFGGSADKDAVLIADRNAVQDVKKVVGRSKLMVAMSIGCIAKCIVRGQI